MANVSFRSKLLRSNNAGNLTGPELQSYNAIGLRDYVIYSLTITVFYGIASVSAVYGEVNSAIKFHKLLLKKVLSLPIFFFDKTPIGSIINRFSKGKFSESKVRTIH